MPSQIQKNLDFRFMKLRESAKGEHPVSDRDLPQIWFGMAASFSLNVNSAKDNKLRLIV